MREEYLCNCKKAVSRLIALTSIFTLTFSNFAFVGKSYASNIAEIFSNGKIHENVIFDANFEGADTIGKEVECNINSDSLNIDLDLKIKKEGYLKDAKIEILPKENEKLNFEVDSNFAESSKEESIQEEAMRTLNIDEHKNETEKDSEKDNDKAEEPVKDDKTDSTKYEKYVENFDKNLINLKQLMVNSNVEINVPIKYKNEQYVDKKIFSNSAMIKLTGVYVDGEGKEHSIDESKELKLSWKDERTIRASSTMNKYINYGEGVILQTIVKIDNSAENNTMPVCESEVEIEVPKILGNVPETVNVAINKLEATNGETNEKNSFSRDNWKYFINDGKIVINVQNSEKTRKYYNEELEGLKKQELGSRYYNGSGVDEYVITYIYPGVNASQSSYTAQESINAKMEIFSGIEKEKNRNVVTVSETNEFLLENQNGEIVSLEVENLTEDLSKAYFYANYNKLGTYDLSIVSKYVLNVANKGLIDNLYLEDMQNYYLDKSGESIDNNDLSYKEITISKANFDEILGEDGSIKILNAEDQSAVYGTIDKNSNTDTNGDISFFFGDSISKIRFEISKPVSEGNLVMKTSKGLGNLSIPKESLQNMDSILTRTDFNAKYSGVEEVINLGTKNTMTKLLDTKTRATLVVSKEKLSTLTPNENVDIKIELNNDEKTSDLYGHAEFEIDYPSHVENLEIENTSLLYGEGLDISYIKNEDRKIKVGIDGVQSELNSGRLTHGTNIVITANVNVDEFTPAMYESFKMNYTNSEATDYYENGVTDAYVKYLSPSGLVSVNTIKNYKDDSSIITSVNQGTKNDSIGMYQDRKRATMELLLMNNCSDDVEELRILGKFPHKGMIDSLTNEDMGNTQDIEVFPIIPGDNISDMFEIYYSEEENPTDELENESNKWTTDFYSVSNVKSYLIIPVNSDYKLYKSDIIRFNYDMVIPANLGHGEKIVGTFKTVCKNNTSNGALYETSYPDVVYVDTEEGPEIETEINVESEEVYENEEIYTSVIVRNKGNYGAQNLSLSIPYPENASYVSYYTQREQDITVTENEEGLNVNLIMLEGNKDFVFDVIFKADAYKNTQSNEEENQVELNLSVSASDLGSVIKAKSPTIKIKKAEIVVAERNIDAESNHLYRIGNEIPIGISVRNITTSTIEHLTLEKDIPDNMKLIRISKLTDDGTEDIEKKEENGKIVVDIDKLDSCEVVNYECIFKVENIDDSLLKTDTRTKSIVKVDNKEYSSNELYIEMARSEIELTQETDSSNTYIRENDIVTYTIKIKNVGVAAATGVSFEDTVPPGMTIISYEYTNDGVEHKEGAVASDKIFKELKIKANEEVVFKIQAQAQTDIDSFEKSVTNIAKVNSPEQGVISSNTITHIIEKQDESTNDTEPVIEDYENDNDKENQQEVEQDSNVEQIEAVNGRNDINQDVGESVSLPKVENYKSNKENIERTYKISGFIWEDNNQNGIRENGEGKIDDYPEMKVKLVNASTGVIEDEIQPDDGGYYVFQGVRKGEYYILLDYNTRKYGITTYKKSGISEIVNSDIIASKVEENGIETNKAITDKLKIENQSKSNIDMGLFYAERFDLEVENTVTQIMVQTSKGMNTSNFDNVKLAKEEIAASELNSSTVYVEYTVKVKNNGDVSGYAKKIVDYVSGEMEFNSALEANKGWFSGTDGNVYSNRFANVELKPGETRELKLVLQKKMTDENTGIVSNQVEIASDYNIYGIADIDSIPGNNVQAEDDMSIADAIITIETGEKIIYSIFIITGVTVLIVGGFAGYKKIDLIIKSKKENEEEE